MATEYIFVLMVCCSQKVVSEPEISMVVVTDNVTTLPDYSTDQEPGSSGSKVSDYGLDDLAIGVRSPVGANNFFI
jgi:hypothetical protein